MDISQTRVPQDAGASADLVHELDQARKQLAVANRALKHAEALRNEAVARELTLQDELQHRVRNMLSTIRLLFRRSVETADTLEHVADHFAGRLDTLARYQSLLVHRLEASIDFEMMVRDELLTLGPGASDRVTMQGLPVQLPFKAAELIGRAVHELTTNAVKFGALSAKDGHLAVSWSYDRQDGLAIKWAETGVSVVASAPIRSGFGREYIEAALPYELDAKTSFELRPGGLVCCIIVPKEWFASCP